MIEEIFTTHEVSKICKVDISTVANWINESKLPAYKTPGGHRRVKAEDLVKFMNKYKMPVPLQLTENKKRILIVDDEKYVVNLIKRYLKKIKSEFDIEIAYDGFEAGTKAISFLPDLIILDIFLPGIDGCKVLEKIKSNEKLKKTKVIAISGKNLAETRKKALSCGADVFMAKPIDFKKLVSTVERFLELA